MNYLAIDIGGTKLAVGVGDEKGNLLSKVFKPTEVKKGVDYVINNIIEMVDTSINQANVDISDFVKQGKNLIEILVYNTLAITCPI